MIVLSCKEFINIGLSFLLKGGENQNKILKYFTNGIQYNPKIGNPCNYPIYLNHQGDVRYVFYYLRCVTTVTHTKTMN